MTRSRMWIFIDNFKRKIFLKFELKKLLTKSLIKSKQIPFTHKYLALYNQSRILRASSVIQQTNRCVNTGRIWGVSKKTKYSRFFFRTEAYKGKLPGFSRASW